MLYNGNESDLSRGSISGMNTGGFVGNSYRDDRRLSVSIRFSVLMVVGPGDAGQFSIAMDRMAKATWEVDKGCVQYEVFRSEKAPERFLLLEEWADEESLEAHKNTPHMLELRKSMTLLIEGPIRV